MRGWASRILDICQLALAVTLLAGCSRADIVAREGTPLGFVVVLFIADVVAPFAFSFVVVPLFGLGALTLRGGKPTLFTYPVLTLLFVAQLYFWELWGAFCSWLALGYAASPRAWSAWIYYVLAFGACTGPIGFLAAKEQATARKPGEVSAIRRGSGLYSLIAILAYVGSAIWPSAAAPVYGWLLSAERDERSVKDTAPLAEPRAFKCKEPLPEFTLGAASNPSDAEVAKLCACTWSKLPEGGWERRVSAQIREGEDPGWRGRAFGPRFGAALDACGGRSL